MDNAIVREKTGIMIFSPARSGMRAGIQTIPNREVGVCAIVERALEVIQYLQPRYCFVENPRTGMLKDRGLLDGLTYADVDYCQFCDWGYH